MFPSMSSACSFISAALSHNRLEDTVLPTPPVLDVTMIIGAICRVRPSMISPISLLSMTSMPQNSLMKSVTLRSSRYEGKDCVPTGI